MSTMMRELLRERDETPPLGGILPRAVTRDSIVVAQHIREGRFQRALALIAGLSSVLGGMEVALEHYRGSYGQRIMYTPVLLTPLLLVAGVGGALSGRVARTLLPLVSLVTMLDGVIGFLTHIRGVARKPGGWRIPIFNVIMGPPVFAPLLFGLSGFLGLMASLLRREDDLKDGLLDDHARLFLSRRRRPRPAWLGLLRHDIERGVIVVEQDVREGRFQQGMALATALLALFNGVEASYSHYKNNFQYAVEWLPIALTPVVMLAGFGAMASRTVARTLLPLASLAAAITGSLGFYYHARGVLKRPGSLRDPLHNLMYGPPVFAPLLFAATGMLGLLASMLRRAR
ncbi:MAG TPA: hypothetical protein VF120_15985 [Ktedonobacterales bacterium]